MPETTAAHLDTVTLDKLCKLLGQRTVVLMETSTGERAEPLEVTIFEWRTDSTLSVGRDLRDAVDRLQKKCGCKHWSSWHCAREARRPGNTCCQCDCHDICQEAG